MRKSPRSHLPGAALSPPGVGRALRSAQLPALSPPRLRGHQLPQEVPSHSRVGPPPPNQQLPHPPQTATAQRKPLPQRPERPRGRVTAPLLHLQLPTDTRSSPVRPSATTRYLSPVQRREGHRGTGLRGGRTPRQPQAAEPPSPRPQLPRPPSPRPLLPRPPPTATPATESRENALMEPGRTSEVLEGTAVWPPGPRGLVRGDSWGLSQAFLPTRNEQFTRLCPALSCWESALPEGGPGPEAGPARLPCSRAVWTRPAWASPLWYHGSCQDTALAAEVGGHQPQMPSVSRTLPGRTRIPIHPERTCLLSWSSEGAAGTTRVRHIGDTRAAPILWPCLRASPLTMSPSPTWGGRRHRAATLSPQSWVSRSARGHPRS